MAAPPWRGGAALRSTTSGGGKGCGSARAEPNQNNFCSAAVSVFHAPLTERGRIMRGAAVIVRMAANVNAVARKRPSSNPAAAGPPPPPPPMHKKCSLDGDGCVCLSDILTSFNAPLSEEQAWALCFECARCFERAVLTDRDACYLVEKVEHVFLHKDGLVHNKTILGSGNNLNSNNQGKPSPIVKCNPNINLVPFNQTAHVYISTSLGRTGLLNYFPPTPIVRPFPSRRCSS